MQSESNDWLAKHQEQHLNVARGKVEAHPCKVERCCVKT